MLTTLVVAEKPDAALHIAEALSWNHAPKKVYVDRVPFFEANNKTERIVICSALGHLYVVAEKNPRGQSVYPVWDFEWKPKHLAERGKMRERRWIQAISKVSSNADRFVNGCDLDIEGSLIGYTILKYACHDADKNAGRMKFSTLTETELRDAYRNVLPELDFSMVFAGMCRHEVDWLFGINLSRALTQSAHKLSGRYSTLSTGRVQGPTLRFLVAREHEIETFVPTPYWILRAQMEIDGKLVPAEYEAKKLDTKSEAQQVVQVCDGKLGWVNKLESTTYDVAPPTPFDLSLLQREAYQHLGLSPRASLEIAERLYLDQLISYPRTSSQKLPDSIGYERILNSLREMGYRSETQELLEFGRLVPNQGNKDDPAHPAIYPTGTHPRSLGGREKELFDLVVRRFLATFGATAVRRSDRATVEVSGYKFHLRGSSLVKEGWTRLYNPYIKFDDVPLPPLHTGQQILLREIRSEQKVTQPPPRYNPSSLLRKMEEGEIGTKATRADIIDTLYRRGYVTGERMTATPLAFRIMEILTTVCPKVVDVAFTRELEARMAEIEEGSASEEEVVSEAIRYLKPIIQTLKTKEREIGEELVAILSEMREKTSTLLTPCPKCGSRLKIVKNPTTKKRFIGCSGKWKSDCKFSLPLPQLGNLVLLQKLCPTCGFQLIRATSRGHRSLVSCCRCYATKTRVQSSDSQVTVTPSHK